MLKQKKKDGDDFGFGIWESMEHSVKFKVSSMKMRQRLVKKLGTLNMEL